MGLTNASLVTGSTISVTGGTAVAFTSSGQDITGGIEIIESSPADYRTAKKIVCTSKMPQYNSTLMTYSKGKNIAKYEFPVILASGEVVFPTARLEITWHPEQPVADRLDMRKVCAQMAVDADFEQFWQTGSKA